MSVTRKNHYVPQWHQERFFAPGSETLFMLDTQPPKYTNREGIVSTGRSLFKSPSSRAFVEHDLYSTFFGTKVDDEIERKLFGDIDRRGADAIRAFCSDDKRAWHEHFQTLFEFLDIQKLRTPKGLAWLGQQYPEIGLLGQKLPDLAQNQLMLEMQSIRMLNVTTWTTGTREIVSAERSSVKFIVSDHPVTVYNYAIPPSATQNRYPGDPSIALKGSQTLFPLGPDHLLILTNLEYAKDPYVRPNIKRTFARNYQSTMVSTIDFIKARYLSDAQVAEANLVIKSRANRYIAASRREDLYPEKMVSKPWAELKNTFLPPSEELYRFGGEMFAKFDNGDVHYQDEFGRTEEPRKWLMKAEPKDQPKPRDYCPCGSGYPFGKCCRNKPIQLRTSWTEKSIRERNMMFFNALIRLFDLGRQDWNTVRREMTDDKIAQMYDLYQDLWPLETDLLSLMPKPDGKMRSVFTGLLHPKLIIEFALGTPLFFGEVIIQNPFLISRTIRKEKRPTENPHQYRGEAVKSLMTFLNIMPLVEAGLVTLVPNPCDFDFHLRDQVMAMAKARARAIAFKPSDDPRYYAIMQEDMRRMLLNMPMDTLIKKMLEIDGNEAVDRDTVAAAIQQMKIEDRLAILDESTLSDGGEFQIMKMEPNFEVAMYLAQATGAQILTDSPYRWKELQAALSRRHLESRPTLIQLQREIASTTVNFPVGHDAVLGVLDHRSFREMAPLFRAAFSYTASTSINNLKPNFEAQLAARFRRQRNSANSLITSIKCPVAPARLTTEFHLGGFQDNTINRLLLMSGSEHHMHSVPMATLIERVDVRPRADGAKA
ncbi:DUF4238 domain-containing protein [Agrobacterium cavarae]|uniref:DUF4238 domain-containing protein n=1 Tax=Agrobacterium cavarae TaxID=2528239 RepID=A0ABY1Y722_9HYPH|nr:DUF4238 domain-containing protein [Agrobacterium cavarae]TBN11381.1 DUF4238 domain-containing protein [Agrobacterium cavarae]